MCVSVVPVRSDTPAVALFLHWLSTCMAIACREAYCMCRQLVGVDSNCEVACVAWPSPATACRSVRPGFCYAQVDSSVHSWSVHGWLITDLALERRICEYGLHLGGSSWDRACDDELTSIYLKLGDTSVWCGPHIFESEV